MRKQTVEVDPGLERLEQQHLAAVANAEEYEEVEDETLDQFEETNNLLKDTIILLEYLSNDTFTKSITKRERKAITAHLDRIYTKAGELDELIADLQDDEEEDE